jgi:RNA polymerase sigma factor (sigma-70 family)
VTDDELIAELEAAKPRIRGLALKLVGPRLRDLEDVESIIRVQYVAAAKSWRPDGGASFPTYAEQFAPLEVRRYLDGERRRGVHVPVNKKAKTPEVLEVGDIANAADPVAPAAPSAGWELLEWVERSLQAGEWAVYKAVHVDGLTGAALAKRLGCTRANVSKIMQDAYKRLGSRILAGAA